MENSDKPAAPDPERVREAARAVPSLASWQNFGEGVSFLPEEAAIAELEARDFSRLEVKAALQWHEEGGRLFPLHADPGVPKTLRATPSMFGWSQEQALKDEPAVWSKPDFPSQWARVFACSVDTLKRRVREGKMRVKKLSTKSWQIHVDDLPGSQH